VSLTPGGGFLSLDAFLARFAGVRFHRGRWTAACPAHEDHSRDTLAIALGADARRLLYCWAGCATEDVLERVGLTVRDLFADDRPAPGPRPSTYQDLVADELRRLQAATVRRFGPYRGEFHASAAICDEYRAAWAARRVAMRPDLDEDFRWELLEAAAEWEREALRLEAEQGARFTSARTPSHTSTR
jgi:hypothetical protein